ncbi:MAG: rRNA maturation RNase YbeY [Gemmatimonadetes bacterium]|nr:rRNA maturation RNase YbeY [Gemmatimonadota bacterium]
MPSAVRVQLGAALGQRAAVRRRRTASSDSPAAQPIIPDVAVRRVMARAARAALRRAQARDAEVSITLLDDTEITGMNREFLSHDRPTDVIAFALYEEGEDPVGDVYVGFEQALRQADANRIDPLEELARLAVHGTLHVLGHDHPEGDDRLESEMWQIQESIVSQVFTT